VNVKLGNKVTISCSLKSRILWN